MFLIHVQKQVHNAVKRSIYTFALLAHMTSGIVEGCTKVYLFDWLKPNVALVRAYRSYRIDNFIRTALSGMSGNKFLIFN